MINKKTATTVTITWQEKEKKKKKNYEKNFYTQFLADSLHLERK